jgi:hypothetical protein
LISSTNAGRQQAYLQISFDDGKSHGNPSRPPRRGDPNVPAQVLALADEVIE